VGCLAGGVLHRVPLVKENLALRAIDDPQI
jgi:hypothetical protein